MSVEDKIKEERDEINELEIDDSIKESMLEAFDDTVFLYQDKEGVEGVARAIQITANWTKSEEKIKKIAKILRLEEVIKTVDLCKNEKITEAIAMTTSSTGSEEAVLETVKTLALYHGKKGAEKVAKAIADTANWTQSEEATIETTKTLQLYHGKKGAEKVAKAIADTADYTRSEEATKKVAEILRLDEIIKTVDLYQNEEIAEAITNVALFTRSEEAVIETAKTLQLYPDKKRVEKVAEAIDNIASFTRSEEAVIETAKTLALYHDKKGAGKVAEAIDNVTPWKEAVIETAKTLRLCYDKKEAEKIAEVIGNTETKDKETTIETAKKLRNTKDIYNLDSKLYKEYFLNISDNLSKKIKDSLSIKDINKITSAYTITMDFCKDETFQDKVEEGFFYHLNKATDKGKTIDDKIKIMNKWSDNVYTTFKDHPEDFMEFQKHL